MLIKACTPHNITKKLVGLTRVTKADAVWKVLNSDAVWKVLNSSEDVHGNVGFLGKKSGKY